MRSLGRLVNHGALHALGAVSVSSSETETFYEPDDLNLSSLDAALVFTARQRKIAKTKDEAQSRIFARFPQHKQANMTARSDELDRIESGRYRDSTGALQPARALTTSEINEIASFSAAWAWIKSVRAASDQIEADIAASADPANFDVANSPRWPA